MSGDGSAAPTAPTPGPVLALMLTLVVTALSALLVAAFLPAIDPLMSRALAIVLAVGSVGAFVATQVPPPHGARLGLRGLDTRASVGVALLVPVALLTSEVDNWLRAAYEIAAPAVETGGAGARPLATWIGLLIYVAGIEALVEEWFFRGLLLQGCVARLRALGAVVWCALLYALFSGLPSIVALPRDAWSAVLPNVIQSFLLALVYGYVRVSTGSLVGSIVLHGAIGLFAVGGGALFPIAGFTGPGNHTPMALLVVAAALCAGGGWILEDVRAALAPVDLEAIPDDDEEFD